MNGKNISIIRQKKIDFSIFKTHFPVAQSLNNVLGFYTSIHLVKLWKCLQIYGITVLVFISFMFKFILIVR